MSLPQKLDINQMQTRWASFLDPLIKNPIVNGIFLTNVSLLTGVNVINHLLQRKQQGWIITDQNASASVFRSQPLNGLTLSLTSSGPVIVSIYVF